MTCAQKPRTSSIVKDAVAVCAGDRADRVHGHVAPQLEPDVALDRGADVRLEAGAPQQVTQRQQAVAAYTGRLPDDEAVAEAVAHHTGCHR
jgi:hypothetical protein